MEYKIQTVDEFIEYYDNGYSVDKHDLMSMYKLSERTIYRNIGFKDSPVLKVKISAELLREIREAFRLDNRLTDEHIRAAEKKTLFNEYGVFLYLIKTNKFRIFINVAGIPEQYPVEDIQILNDNTMLENYKAIMWYVWQAHKTINLNAMRRLGKYYDLSNETEKTQYQRALKQLHHIRFEICGVSSYVFMQQGYYSTIIGRDSYQDFVGDLKQGQLKFEIFSSEVMKKMDEKVEQKNARTVRRIKSYLEKSSTYRRSMFFRNNAHLGEEFLNKFKEYR